MDINKKLAEFAGFKYDIWKGWIYPDGENYDEAPNFTQDETACFKWLTPKLQDCWLRLTEDGWEGMARVSGGRIKTAVNKDPALALCNAIIKLLDEK